MVAEELHTVVALVAGVGGDGKVLAVVRDVPKGIGEVKVVEFGVGVPGAERSGQVVGSGVQEGQVVSYSGGVAGI